MDVFLEALMNPGTMTRPQLMLLAIMLLVVAGSLYIILKLYRLLMVSQKSTYVPKIGLKGAATRDVSGSKPDKTNPAE